MAVRITAPEGALHRPVVDYERVLVDEIRVVMKRFHVVKRPKKLEPLGAVDLVVSFTEEHNEVDRTESSDH